MGHLPESQYTAGQYSDDAVEFIEFIGLIAFGFGNVQYPNSINATNAMNTINITLKW